MLPDFCGYRKEPALDWAFGLTMTVMGMSVTLLTLFLLILIIRFLIRLFPFQEEPEKEED
jgi:Na+-transporting methylmalonyl-CoA/oxaloacetate decarboxylase gamma subunit